MTRPWMIYLVWLIFLTAGVEWAKAEPWDATEKALASVAVAATVIDWRQTQYMVEQRHKVDPHRVEWTGAHYAYERQRWDEINPLIGKDLSMARVNLSVVAVLIGGYFLADALPHPWRKALLGGWVVAELAVAAHNKHIGLKVRF